MDLVSCPVGCDLLEGHAPVLDDQDGLVAVGSKGHLDDAVRLVRGPRPQQQTVGRLARLHATGPLPSAGEVARAELSALTQIALHVAEPASETLGIGDR